MSGSIRITGAGKAYKRFSSHRDKWLETLSLGRVRRHQAQWVLRGIDLALAPGESVGVVGYNGAGKSTLLKLIAGVTAPTEGRIEIRGRVAAILELGVGFHLDMSGRHNIALAGQLFGFGAQELRAREEEVVAFAELGGMIDEPVRTYSSGMQARLAFAVATALRPDILIVDEALSVGDAYFQHKSFARIKEFQRQGSTILFVSHDFNAVRSLCDRAVLLVGGRLCKDGPPAAVLDYYNALIAERERAAGIVQEVRAEGVVTRSGSGEAEIAAVQMFDQAGHTALRFRTGEAVTIRVDARVHSPLDSLVAGIMLRDRTGNPIFGTNSWYLQQTLHALAAGETAQISFGLPLNLGPGSYSLTVALTDSETHLTRNYAWHDNCLVFEVANLDQPEFVGAAWLPTEVRCERRRPEGIST